MIVTRIAGAEANEPCATGPPQLRLIGHSDYPELFARSFVCKCGSLG
jgi:hypothetical protein